MPVKPTGNTGAPPTPHSPSSTEQKSVGQSKGRSVSDPGVVQRQTSIPLGERPSGKSLQSRSVSLSEPRESSKNEPVAGRGKVQILDNGCIQKEANKWEVVNYARIFQDPANTKLAEFCPPDIYLQTPSGEEVSLYDLPQDSSHYQSLLQASDTTEFSVQLTNAAPSGKVVDVKTGDIISTTADKLHGKTSAKRTLKRQWHIAKQNANRSGVTIQEHKGGLKREMDELRHAERFIQVLKEKTHLGELSSEEQKSSATQMIQKLDDLQQAVTESNIGFVGVSLLLSFEGGEPKITLIDVENCVLPEDPKVTETSIQKKKGSFTNGIETMKQELNNYIATL